MLATAAIHPKDFMWKIDVGCANCGRIASLEGVGIQLIQCGKCLEAYCSFACKESLAKTHHISCPKLEHRPDPCWATTVAKFVFYQYQTLPRGEQNEVPLQDLFSHLQHSCMMISLNGAGSVLPESVQLYSRFDAPDHPPIPVSAEIKAHLAALSAKIPYISPKHPQGNCSDLMCIVMQENGDGSSTFLGTIRLHPTIPH